MEEREKQTPFVEGNEREGKLVAIFGKERISFSKG